MGVQFWYFYDIIAAAVIIVSMYIGYRRGIMKTVMMVVGFIVSFAVSWIVSPYIANSVYDNFLKEKNSEIITDAINRIDYASNFRNKLEEYGIELDDEATKMLLDTGSTDSVYNYLVKNGVDIESRDRLDSILAAVTSDTMQEMFGIAQIPFSDSISDKVLTRQNDEMLISVAGDILNGSIGTNTAKFESGYLRSIEVTILRTVFTTIIMAVLMIIAGGLSEVFSVKEGRLALARLDNQLGAVAGLIPAAFVLFVVVGIVHILVSVGKEEMIFFNDDVINKTVLFKYIYRLILNVI